MNRQSFAAILAVFGVLSLSHNAAVAAEPYDRGDALVVRLEALSDISPFGPIISLHADGRLITIPPAMEPGATVQRLSTETVAAIRQLLADSGLFGPAAPATAEYVPQLRPGKEPPGRGSAQQRIIVGRPIGSVSAVFEVVSDYEAGIWFESPEAQRLAPLQELMWSLVHPAAPDGSDPGWVAYTPNRYQLTLGGAHGVAIAGIDWPLATPPEALAVTPFTSRFQGGWPSADRLRCAVISPEEAVLVADALSRGPLWNANVRMMFEVRGSDGETHTLKVEALLPDERGCGSTSPDTALTPDPGDDATPSVAGLVLVVFTAVTVARRAVGKRSR